MRKLTTINLMRINQLVWYLSGFIFVAVVSLQGWYIHSSYNDHIKNAENQKLEYLKGIVLTIAAAIDGDAYEELLKRAPLKRDIRENNQEAIYKEIQVMLNKGYSKYGLDDLRDELYIINFEFKNNKYLATKGVVPQSPKWRYPVVEPTPLENLPSIGYYGPLTFEREKKLIALAPFHNSEDKIVGFSACTVDYRPILDSSEEHLDQLLWNQGFFALGLFILLTGFVVGIRRAALHEQERTSVASLRLTNTYKIIEEFVDNVKRGDYQSKLRLEAYKDDNLAKALDVLHKKLADNAISARERNWIAEGRLKIASILRMHKDFEELALEVVMEVTNYMQAVQGAFYICDGDGEDMVIEMKALYAYDRRKYTLKDFKYGQGLVGQCAFEKETIYRTEIPEEYTTISSGILGQKKPASILLVPLMTDGKLFGILELASTNELTPIEIRFIEELSDIIARTIFNLKTNIRTLDLLKETQEKSKTLEEQQIELQQNERKVHSLLQNSSEVISIYDEEGIVQYQSPSVTHILGYTPEEIVGKSDIKHVHPMGRDLVNGMFQKLLSNTEEQDSIEFSYQRKDSSWIWMEAVGRNFLNDPAVNGIVVNSRDITERRLRESEQLMRGKMQALSENSRDVIIRFDLKGNFLYVNPMLEEHTGISTDNFNDAQMESCGLDPAIIEGWQAIIEEIKTNNKLVASEMNFPTSNGQLIMLVSAIPEFDVNDQLETVLMVSHDITDRKQQEQAIQLANKKITDSINYARHIQNSIIPDNEIIQEHFKESFIFYKAKDVVSGDFPWLRQKGDDIYFAAVDCTGHGVPGAMMSLIGYFLLNQITNHEYHPNPAEVLTDLHQGVRETLRQDREGAQARDGMDVALCKINLKKGILDYSGAHRPLYLVRNGELTQYKGARQAIGGTLSKGEKPFENHTIELKEGDKIYFFSDGLPDQFGGPKNRKYSPARIRELAIMHHDKDMQEMNKILLDDFETWKGTEKQMDDVLLIGIKF